MDNNDLTHHREILIALRDNLMQSIAGPTSTGKSVAPDNAIGRLTRMEALQAQAMSDAGRERQRKRLKAVELALKAVDEGTYGVCMRCGEAIPAGRLEVMPESRVCIDCARRG